MGNKVLKEKKRNHESRMQHKHVSNISSQQNYTRYVATHGVIVGSSVGLGVVGPCGVGFVVGG